MSALTNSIAAPLQPYFGQLGQETLWQQIEQRTRLPGLAADYAVEYDVRHALAPLTANTDIAGKVWVFEKVTQQRRRELHRAAVARLHQEWIDAGGELRMSPESSLEAFLSAMIRGNTMIAGSIAVTSEWFGMIDPTALNLGLGLFSGGTGQIQLLATLAVVTGRFNLSLQSLSREFRKAFGNPDAQRWKPLSFDWRRGRIILTKQALIDDKYRGLTGYKQFARDFADGSMQKAHSIAATLCTHRQFRRLDWGKVIRLQVDQVDVTLTHLRAGLTDGSLCGASGWLRYHSQVSQRARAPLPVWQNASALLDDEFAKLGWPSQSEAVVLANAVEISKTEESS